VPESSYGSAKTGLSGHAHGSLVTRRILALPVFLLSLLCSLNAAPAGIEATAGIGVSLYGDSTGLTANLGVQAAAGDVFATPAWLENVVVGVSGLYDGVLNPEIPVFLLGADITTGYQLFLFGLFPGLKDTLPPAMNLRFVPALVTGLAFERIDRLDFEYFSGLAFHLAPQLTVDTAPFAAGSLQALRLGLTLGYHSYLSTRTIQSFRLGVFSSWTF
jgi:hypothetical protein